MSSRLLILLASLTLSGAAFAQPDPSLPAPVEDTTKGDDEGPATGDEASPPKSDAEVLFEQGLADMQAGEFAKGCPALAESYRLDPLPGALFTLAECQRMWGKLSTAQGHYRDYLSQVERMSAETKERQGERPTIAEEALKDLETAVPSLTVSVAEGIPDTAIVMRGEARIAPTQLGRPIPLDPGEHVLTLEVPGREPVTKTVMLEAGDTQSVMLDFPAEAYTPEPETMTTLRVAAYATGSVGIAGVVVGVIAGAIAINRNEEIDENCVELVCNETGISKVETVREAGNTATVALVIGAAGMAAGITLWLLADAEEEKEEEDATEAWIRPLVTAQGFGFRW